MREGGLRKCEAAVVRGENPGFEVSKGYDDTNKHGDQSLKCLKYLEIGYGYYGWVLMYC